MQWASKYVAMTPADGAKTQLYAATSPEVDSKKLRFVLSLFIARSRVADVVYCNQWSVSHSDRYCRDTECVGTERRVGGTALAIKCSARRGCSQG